MLNENIKFRYVITKIPKEKDIDFIEMESMEEIITLSKIEISYSES